MKKKAKKRALNESNEAAPSKSIKNKFDQKHLTLIKNTLLP